MTRRARRAGQALAEFALTVPVLLMLMLGVLDVGRGILAMTTLANAVREGARVGVAAYPASGWQTQASNRAISTALFLDTSQMTLTVAQETSGADTYVRVTGQYTFRSIVPYITLVAPQIPFSSSARMLVG